MKTQEACALIEAEFGNAIKRDVRDDGYAYYWRTVNKSQNTTRLVRVSGNKNGSVTAIKLAQSSRDGVPDVLLPPTVSHEELANAIHAELVLLLGRGAR